MSGKVSQDAFAFYVALGSQRSYQAVADHFGVSKRAVVNAATRERWAERLAEIEKKTRELTDAKLADDLHEQNLRHRKMLKAMAGRAAQALSQFPLQSGMEGIKAAEAAIKLERLLAGQPSERSEVTVAEVTRQEIDRFLATKDEPKEGDGDTADW